MKGSKDFTHRIKSFLDDYSTKDKLFKKSYENPDKNITDCVSYIIGEVYRSKTNAYAQEDIFQMAIHYYDEKDIKINSAPQARIVVPEDKTEVSATPLKVVKKKEKQKATPVVENSQNQLELF